MTMKDAIHKRATGAVALVLALFNYGCANVQTVNCEPVPVVTDAMNAGPPAPAAHAQPPEPRFFRWIGEKPWRAPLMAAVFVSFLQFVVTPALDHAQGNGGRAPECAASGTCPARPPDCITGYSYPC
jgi:hypothetical protein